jgi:hypothetical protein
MSLSFALNSGKKIIGRLASVITPKEPKMRLRVDFGTHGKRREIVWWQPLEDFPKLFQFEGKKWEWFMYDADKSGHVDFILTYSELPSYDPNFYADMDDFDEKFGHRLDPCQCGAKYTSFPQIHLFFCPQWKKI